MKVLIIDFETTGLLADTDRITEIGAQVCDDKFLSVTEEFSELCYASDYPELSAEVTKVTRISNEMLKEHGIEPRTALLRVAELAKKFNVGFAIAYNSGFDRGFFEAEVKRLGIDTFPEIKYLLNTTWLCAMTGVESNYNYKCWKLSHLSLDYGLAVDPSILHRAVNDVNLTRRLLSHIRTDAKSMYEFQTSPWVYVRALTMEPWKDKGKSNALAKAAGYAYQTPRGDDRVFEKMWVKKVKASKYEQELLHPFQVRQVV